MQKRYFSRAPRYVSGGKNRYFIETRVLNTLDEERKERDTKSFELFIRELKKGATASKAARRVLNKYKIKIQYEEMCDKTDKNFKRLKVLVDVEGDQK